jgi:outer membrane lipoprotein-sorting protein
MQKKYLVILSIMIVGLLVLTSPTVLAITGEEVLDEVDKTLDSNTRRSEIKMTIVNENGQKRERTVEIVSKGDNKGLVQFLAPADVEGTSFLTLTEDGEENMWLFLPAIGNVRKIASHMRNGSFMGTDFTYNDISMLGGSDYRSDYQSNLAEEVEYDGKTCYLLESQPTDQDIQYSRMKMWVNKANYVPLKMEFYDEEDNLLKVMTNKNIKNIDGHLTPNEITMENVQAGTKTILSLSNVEYNVEIPDRVFTTRYMQQQ